MAITKRSWLAGGSVLAAAMLTTGIAAAGAASRAPGARTVSHVATTKIGVDLTYDNTAFWAAYDTYEKTYAPQMHIQVIGPLLSAASASLQNSQIETLVNEGAKAVIVNPETATSLGPAIAYAAKKHVKLVTVDTIVGVGKVYMVVRASNLLYGEQACAYISSKVKSGDVLELEGDLTSSNGADRATAFAACMALNDPGVKVIADPTVWTDATAVTDAQDAISTYGSSLKAIYSAWSSPDLGILPLLQKAGDGPVGSSNHVIIVSDDGVAFEMCDIGKGLTDASSSQPANEYAYYALKYALASTTGVKYKSGESTGHGTSFSDLAFNKDVNLGDPIVAPFVTKTAETLKVKPVDGLPGTITTTAVTDPTLWGNSFGKAHGGVCSAANA